MSFFLRCHWSLARGSNTFPFLCPCTTMPTAAVTCSYFIYCSNLSHSKQRNICFKWNVCVFHSNGETITWCGMDRNIQAWAQWGFPATSFGSQTFCCITGRCCQDPSAGCGRIIGHACCHSQKTFKLHVLFINSCKKDVAAQLCVLVVMLLSSSSQFLLEPELFVLIYLLESVLLTLLYSWWIFGLQLYLFIYFYLVWWESFFSSSVHWTF